MKIKIKVTPNSKNMGIIKEKNKGKNEEIWKIKIDAPAEKGKANKRLIEILSDYFKIPKNKIKIIKGRKSRNKIIEIKI